jgi:large subunit ribosomal protein L17
LLSALSTALIKHKRIRTTTAKAKETRRIIEPIITRAKKAYLSEQSGNPVDIHSRRVVSKFIRDEDVVKILFSEVAEKVAKRNGGYTRVLKLGARYGDGAELSVIELVDYNVAQDSKKRKDRAEKSKAAAQRRKIAEEKKGKKETVHVKAVEEVVAAPVAIVAEPEVIEEAMPEVMEAPEVAIDTETPADEATPPAEEKA